jgi:proteasome accessory factor C
MRTLENRIPRVLVQLTWLINNRNVSLDDFCQEFGLTLDEGIKDLTLLTYVGPSQYGGDLVDIQFDQNNISVIDSQGLNRPFKLNSQEAALLLLGVKYLKEQSEDNSIFNRVEAKLNDMLNESSHQLEEIKRYDEFKNIILGCIESKTAISMDYVNKKMLVSVGREVHPIRIYVKDRKNYFDAYDSSAKCIKSFKIENILALIESDAAWINSNDSSYKQNQFELKIITKYWKKWIFESNGIDFTIDSDGNIHSLVTFFDIDYIVNFILKLGVDIDVQADEDILSEIRQSIHKRLDSIS